MRSTPSLLQIVKKDFPHITFVRGDTFRWSPQERTVYYANISNAASLLHETAHGVLGHGEYTSDIELLKMERSAWDYASTTLSEKYNVPISQETVESMLDTYRDWLHDRSRCPGCEATGIQEAADRYVCMACKTKWRVNEARSCALRRYKLPLAQ